MDLQSLLSESVNETHDFFSQEHHLKVRSPALLAATYHLATSKPEPISSSFDEEKNCFSCLDTLEGKLQLQEFIQQGQDDLGKRLKMGTRILAQYDHVKTLPLSERKKIHPNASITNNESRHMDRHTDIHQVISTLTTANTSKRLLSNDTPQSGQELISTSTQSNTALMKSPISSIPTTSSLQKLGIKRTISSGEDPSSLYSSRPTWHAPWEMMTLISGHLGWVRCITVDPTNTWFATGSADRTIKIWDLARHTLKLTLTGHISAVRSLAASDRHPYLFSSGEDQKLMCWDLETNRAIRQYFGHRSGIYSIALHPALDLIISGSRDRSVCVWDMRTRAAIYTFSDHESTVFSVAAQASEPQVISGSSDSTIRFWDLRTGRCSTVLTNHKKTVRALLLHKQKNILVSAGADAIKKWKLPEGNFMHNFTGHNGIINSLALNHENVMVSAADNDTLTFWDWKTAYQFQTIKTIPQPGSLESEAGICATAFDRTGSRLITCEIDKSIKIWRENPDATPETHPIQWKTRKHKVEW